MEQSGKWISAAWFQAGATAVPPVSCQLPEPDFLKWIIIFFEFQTNESVQDIYITHVFKKVTIDTLFNQESYRTKVVISRLVSKSKSIFARECTLHSKVVFSTIFVTVNWISWVVTIVLWKLKEHKIHNMWSFSC